MGKFLTAGIIQRETIVKVPQLPIQYSRVTRCYDTIFGGIGGDAYIRHDRTRRYPLGRPDGLWADASRLCRRYLRGLPGRSVYSDKELTDRPFISYHGTSSVCLGRRMDSYGR